jgi:hypothetical protein
MAGTQDDAEDAPHISRPRPRPGRASPSRQTT